MAPQSIIAANLRQSATASGRSPRAQVLELRKADGTEVVVEVSSSRAEWHGQPARRLTMHPSTNPSARLRRLVTGVFSEVSDAVIVTDPYFNIRSWNQAAERLYGWTEQEVLGRHLFAVVPLAENDGSLSTYVRALEEGGRWFGEHRQLTRDGSLVHISTSTTLLRDEAGEPIVVVFVNRRSVTGADALVSAPDSLTQADLQRGLARDELVVHYQPVVALNDLHIVTLEALVRWNHPELGLLPPAAFISLAEDSDLIIELGRRVLESACKQTATWRSAGFDLSVAINLSTKQFVDQDLVACIAEMLANAGLDPRALWLEITETALVEGVDRAVLALEKLAAMGVGIAVDDFGTGWASLTYLKQFPVHALKIDRSFVAGIDTDAEDRAIARSIISLGEELDLLVIAEGVETTSQLSVLQELECAIGQGYLFGRPVAASEVQVARAHRI